MKNINKILTSLILLGSLTFVSCEDFLDTTSKSTMDETVAFSNIDFAKQEVFAVYQIMIEDVGYSKRLNLYYGVDSDIELIVGDPDGGRRNIARYMESGLSGNTELAGPWNNLYKGIERANICLDNLPKSGIWNDPKFSAEAKALYGEVLTLRALYYFELMKVWGDVPFKDTKTNPDGSNFYLPKTDRDVIYKHLIEDLRVAAEYLPWFKEMGTVERVNKGFVKALRARMSLYYAGYSLRGLREGAVGYTRRGGEGLDGAHDWKAYYDTARKECREIIISSRHQLNPSFEEIFKNQCAYKLDMEFGESMFEVAFGRDQSGEIGDYIGVKHSNLSKYGRADGAIYTHPYYFYSFDQKDKRRDVTVALYDYNDAANANIQNLSKNYAMRMAKWRKQWINPIMSGGLSDQKFTGVNWSLMRYSDVLLMFAEAENELNNGPTDAAKEAFRMVRERAFDVTDRAEKVTKYMQGLTDKNSFFNAIVEERKLEFGGEMTRKYDLVRWNIMGEKIAEAKAENLRMIDASDAKYETLPNNVFWTRNGEIIEILNLYDRLDASDIPGYEKASWLSGMSDKDKDEQFKAKLLDYMAAGYKASENNYLYPLHNTVINDSNGTLSNDIY